MPMQFWNNEKTDKSFNALNRIAKQLDFVLIGGWAVYLYTNMQRSEDVDIAVGYESLDYFRRFGIRDYEGINVKYSVLEDGTVVDLFIEEYSDKDLPIPVNIIMKNYVRVGEIKVVSIELLFILKLWGYFRFDEIKHRKDVIDVLSLLFYGNVNLKKVKAYFEEFKIENRKGPDALLEYVDKGSTLYTFITDSKEGYERLKQEYKRKIRYIFYKK